MPFTFKMTNCIMMEMAYKTEMKYEVWICNLAELCFLHRYKVRCYWSAHNVGEGALGRCFQRSICLLSPLSQCHYRLGHKVGIICHLRF